VRDRARARPHQGPFAGGKTTPVGAVVRAVDDFRRDPMFPRVERVVAALLANGKVVAPVDVLV